jgi:hypothetical protein
MAERSACITGRRPTARDVAALDYDVDSEEDWEEEPEGTDLEVGCGA